MIKKGRKVMRFLLIFGLLIYVIAKVFDAGTKASVKERRVRHVDRTTSEFDEIW
jgi:hypothetical protein